MSKETKIKHDQSRNNNLKESFKGVFCADKLRGAYWFQTTNQAGFSFFFFFFFFCLEGFLH